MTISYTQDSVYKPKFLVESELDTSMDVSISYDGTWIASGVPYHSLDEDSSNPLSEAGACYISKIVNGINIEKQKIVDLNRAAGAHFGSRVWMSSYGRRLFVSSKDDSNTIASGGSVSVYDLD